MGESFTTIQSPQVSANSVEVAVATIAAMPKYKPSGRSQNQVRVRAENRVRKSETEILR